MLKFKPGDMVQIVKRYRYGGYTRRVGKVIESSKDTLIPDRVYRIQFAGGVEDIHVSKLQAFTGYERLTE